jgi:MerR family transcriptional regulator, copper efflux regulator
MTNASGPFRSGELARLTGVSADTLRFYEKHSLLAQPPRTTAGYRLYPAESLQRVRLIRGALSLGFSVAELKQLLRQRDNGGAPCLFARKLVQAKLEDVERNLHDMRTYRTILQKAARAWDARIAASPANARLGLLEAFVEANPESTQRLSPLLPSGLRQIKRKGIRT